MFEIFNVIFDNIYNSKVKVFNENLCKEIIKYIQDC